MTKIKYLAFLLVIVSSAFDALAQSYWVTGRVIDESGHPVEDAVVFLNYSCDGCWEKLVPTAKSMADGEFILNNGTRIKSDMRLVVAGPVPKETWTPLSPTDPFLQKVPEFSGKSLSIAAAYGTIRVGDIKPCFMYGDVFIDIGKLFGAKPLKEGSTVSLDVSYGSIKIAHGILVDQKAIDQSRQTIKMALPKGDWRLVFKVMKGNKLEIRHTMVEVK